MRRASLPLSRGVVDGSAKRKRIHRGPAPRRRREVWISGRRVGDITTDPVFRRPIQSIAQLYDLQTQPEHREVMTYAGEAGVPAPRS